LRLLRAFRLAAELGFRIEPGTRKQIKKDAHLISQSANERVRDELFRILAQPCSSVWVRELENTGILDIIIPEIEPMKRSARRFYFHPQGLWQHSIETLISLEDILNKLQKFFPDYPEKIKEHLRQELSPGVTRLTLLKFVALLHDVAKPACAKRIGKRMRFLGHETKGADMMGRILKRLRLSNKEVKIARHLVENHMRPIGLGQAGVLTDRAAVRLFREVDNDLPDLALLALSDCYSYRKLHARKPVELKQQECTMKELVRRYYRSKEKGALPKLVDGHLLMKKLHLEPGPIIGKILKAVTEAQMLGAVTTREQALALATKTLTRLEK